MLLSHGGIFYHNVVLQYNLASFLRVVDFAVAVSVEFLDESLDRLHAHRYMHILKNRSVHIHSVNTLIGTCTF